MDRWFKGKGSAFQSGNVIRHPMGFMVRLSKENAGLWSFDVLDEDLIRCGSGEDTAWDPIAAERTYVQTLGASAH